MVRATCDIHTVIPFSRHDMSTPFTLDSVVITKECDAVVGGGLHWFTLDIAEVAINHYLTKSFYLILLSIDPDDMYK